MHQLSYRLGAPLCTYFSSYRTVKNLEFFHAKTRTTNIRVKQNEKNTHIKMGCCWFKNRLSLEASYSRVANCQAAICRDSQQGWKQQDAMAGRSGFIHGDLPSGELTKSYWKWPFIVGYPIKNGDFPLLWDSSPEGNHTLMVIFVYGNYPWLFNAAMAICHL